MHHDALIAAFRQLHTNDSRLNAIEALAQELTSHEWRRLKEIAAARTFQIDIVGQLPLELVAQVFAHLDTSTPYRLQRVSRKWRHVLQSPEVLTDSLVSWYSYTPQLLRADYSLCKLKAEAIHGFRYGSPKHHCRINIEHSHGQMILKEDTLAFTIGGQNDTTARTLHLFNIDTWRLHSLNGHARERISQIFISDDIAGFTTDSHVCYVSDLEDHGKHAFRVPSTALFQAVTCRGRTVACAGCLKNHAEVYIWNYDTQQGKSFSINFSTHLFPYPKVWRNHKHGIALLLQPDTERIIVFTDERCSGGNEFDESYCPREEHKHTYRYAQFTYDGECIFESQFVMEAMYPFQHATFQNGKNDFTPVDDKGTFKISFGSFNYAPATRWIQFDERVNKFTQPPAAEDGQMWVSRSTFWWKDTVFSSLKATEQLQSSAPAFLAHMGTSNRPKNKPLLLHKDSPDGNVDSVPTRDSVVLNEKYVVRALPDGFHIFCFGNNTHFPKESGDFFGQGTVDIIETWRRTYAL